MSQGLKLIYTWRCLEFNAVLNPILGYGVDRFEVAALCSRLQFYDEVYVEFNFFTPKTLNLTPIP